MQSFNQVVKSNSNNGPLIKISTADTAESSEVKTVGIQDSAKFYEQVRQVWSSGKMLRWMMASQLSQTKLNMNQLSCRLSILDKTPSDILLGFLDPFAQAL